MKKMQRHRSRYDHKKESTELEHFNKGHINREGSHSWNEDIGEEIHQQPPKEQYLEKQLEPGDTLQTLSIQFNCPISELKRINNIHRDNEVFARRIIKVPVKYYSLLSEKLVGVHKSSAVIDNTQLTANSKSHLLLPKFADHSVQEDNITLSDNIVAFLSKEIATTSASATKSLLPTEYEEDETINDSSVLLPESHVITKPEDCINDVFQCSGSDWGLSWLQLLTCTLLLLLGGPILYLLYHAESGGATNAFHSSDTTSRIITSSNHSLQTI